MNDSHKHHEKPGHHEKHHERHEHRFEIVVDNEKYFWEKHDITGTEVRHLASIPESVLLFEHIHGKPDREIELSTRIELHHHMPTCFSTQSPGSQAGK